MADKSKALETALQQIEKQYGKGAIMRLGQTNALNVEAISTGSIMLDQATGIGGLPKGRIVKSTAPNPQVKQLLLFTLLQKLRKTAVRRLSLMPSTLLTPPMQRLWVLTLIPFLFHSPTTVSRHLKLQNILQDPVLLTLLLSTLLPLLFPALKSRVKWVTATLVCTRDLCLRLFVS